MRIKEPAKLIVPHRDQKPSCYCVKTKYHDSGKVECDFVRDEKTKLPIAFEIDDKPLDGVFEEVGATTYYSYHMGYEDAARQIASVKAFA